MKYRVVYYIMAVQFTIWLPVEQRQLQLYEFECQFPILLNNSVQTLPTVQKINSLKRSVGINEKTILISKGMKRIGNLYSKIYDLDNLKSADIKASKGKGFQFGVKVHSQNRDNNILELHELLKNKTFRTSPYTTFKIYEPKEREIFRLPYFPDRITHHAIINVIGPIFISNFTADTYSCIKGKGIHATSFAVRKALRDMGGATYCLKLDIKKFYPSVDHEILKDQLRRKFKDKDLLWLLDEIIDSAPGIPIGNLLSQFFANFYLSPFDHWLKEKLSVKYYFRYADDIVILSSNKPYLHQLLVDIKTYLADNLKLQVKPNHRIFPVKDQGIDFVGYVHFHTHTLLRKSIKKNFARMLASNPNDKSLASYYGWTKHCNSINLLNKLIHSKTQTS
jgi:RNA-directed DNA polymerase